MPVLTSRGSGTPVTSGATWTTVTNAVDGTPPANPSTYAVWTSSTSGATGYIEVSGYNFSAIPAGSTITQVQVSLRHFESNTSRIPTVRVEPFGGTTSLATFQGVVPVTSVGVTPVNFNTLTLAQLQNANFKLRASAIRAAVTQSATFNVDHIDVAVTYTEPVPSVTQAAYQWFAEGTETGATPYVAQDTAVTGNTGNGDATGTLRIRLQSTTAIAVPATDDWQLQWEKNASGTWTNVTASPAAVSTYDSPNLTNGAATTNRLTGGSGTFVAGKVSEDALMDDLGWAGNNYTELVYALKIYAANVVDGDTLRFRVLRNGATTGMTYTATPTMNIVRIVTVVTATRSTTWEVRSRVTAATRATTWNVLYTAAKVATFTADFQNTGPPLTDDWTLTSGTPTKSTSRLQLDVVDTYETVTSKATLDMRDSSLLAQLWPPTNAAQSREAYLGVITGNNALLVGVAGALGSRSMICRITTNGVNDDYYYTSYDPFDQQYMRIRVSGTTAYFDGSEDGFTWVNISAATRTFSFDVSSVQVQLKAGQWQTEAAPSSVAFIDNVNLVPAFADIATINTDLTSAAWYHATDVVATPNRFEFPATTNYLYAETFGNAWSIKDSRVSWHVAQVADPTAEADLYAGIGAYGNSIWPGVDYSGWVGGPVGVATLYLSVREENSLDTVHKWTGAWDSAKPVLSLRNTSGVWYYERSATGEAGTWETLWSGTLRIPEVRCYLGFYQDVYADQPALGAARIESVNTPIEPPSVVTLAFHYDFSDPAARTMSGANCTAIASQAGHGPTLPYNGYDASEIVTTSPSGRECVRIDGTTGDVGYSETLPANFTSSLITICAAYKLQSPREWARVVSLGPVGAQDWQSSGSVMLGRDNNRIPCINKGLGGGSQSFVYPDVSYEDAWNVVTCTIGPAGATTIRVNGSVVKTGTLDMGAGVLAARLGIGGQAQGGNTGDAFVGEIGEVKLWEGVLDSTAIDEQEALLSSRWLSAPQWITTDDFDYGSDRETLGDAWAHVVGFWGLRNNQAARLQGGNDFATHYDDIGSSDHWAEALIVNDTNFTCLDVRCRDPFDIPGNVTAYVGFWDPGGWFAMGRTVNGVWQGQFATSTGISHPALPYTLRFQAQGSTLSLYANDVKVLEATDTVIPTGQYVGMNAGYSGTTGVIDNFRASTFPYVPPEAPETTPVSASRGTTWAVSSRITATRATTWAVRTPVAATRATTWVARAPVTATRASTWTVRTGIAVSRATTWTVRTPVTAATRATTWAVRTPVTATRATTWTVTTPVTAATRATTWAVTTTVASSRATTWSAAAGVVATRATTWNVAGSLVSVTATRATTWVARFLVTGTRATTWTALAGITSTRATTWTVRTPVGAATRATTWDVDIGVSATRATTWSVLTPVAPATRATTWVIQGLITSSRATTWNVAGALTFVSTTRATTWVARALVTGTRPTTWVTRVSVTTTRATTWLTGGAVLASRATSWFTRTTVTTTRATAWATTAPVILSRATTWGVKLGVLASRATTWNVAGTLAFVQATRPTTWAVRSSIAATRATTWFVRTPVTGTRATTWAVRAVVNPTRATTWVARSTTTANRPTTWTVRAPVTAPRSTTWNTRIGVATARLTTWTVRVPVAAARATTWDVTVTLTVARSTSWALREVVLVTVETTWAVELPDQGFVVATRATRWVTGASNVLNTALAVYLGMVPVDAVYCQGVCVWSRNGDHAAVLVPS